MVALPLGRPIPLSSQPGDIEVVDEERLKDPLQFCQACSYLITWQDFRPDLCRTDIQVTCRQ